MVEASSRVLDAQSGPEKSCDLVLKGGITSGVVYPLAIVELAKTHRFHSIGGTSAGAIAAAFTAAAELNRDGGGFDRLAELPAVLSRHLLSFFQPRFRYRGVFSVGLIWLSRGKVLNKAIKSLAVASKAHPLTLLLAMSPTIALVAAEDLGPVGITMAVLMIMSFVPMALVARLTFRLALNLPRTQFGLCPCVRQRGYDRDALGDWLAKALDAVAGKQPGDAPLTFGELEGADIQLRIMTTNISQGRPHRLPGGMSGFFFKPSELEQLLPSSVVDHMIAYGRAVDGASDIYSLPQVENLPVVFAVRLSLSFPILIAAVPLYTHDATHRFDEAEQRRLRRCWFSDGGISSNFPIHFFDALWPTRPTFAISLEEFSTTRHGRDEAKNRVRVTECSEQPQILPLYPVRGVSSFVWRLVSTAKDWQDTLQSTLPGYRERIAHVALTPDEGGLNLDMRAEVVEKLVHYGQLASRRMREFDFDEHRWLRFLVSLAGTEEAMETLSDTYEAGFSSFLKGYPTRAQSHRADERWAEAARARADEIGATAREWKAAPLRHTGPIPWSGTDLRVTPKA